MAQFSAHILYDFPNHSGLQCSFLPGNITAIIILTLTHTVFDNRTYMLSFNMLSLVSQIDYKPLEYRNSQLIFESSTLSHIMQQT